MGVGLDLLRAEYRRRGEVFIDCRQELDTGLVEKALRAPEFLVDGAEGRTAVAADEAGRVQAGGPVQRALHQRDTHERLGPGQEDAARFAPVAVEQLVIVEGKGSTKLVCCSCHGGRRTRWKRTVSQEFAAKGYQSSRSYG